MNKKNITAFQRSSKISEQERESAKKAITAFDKFLKKLWAARQSDQRLINVLKEHSNTPAEELFKIRHLLRRFQWEVKDRYTDIIIAFAGKKDKNFETVTDGYIHLLKPLEKDTITRKIKLALQDAMQQLSEFLEEFLEAFEDFHNPEQIKIILHTSSKVENLFRSIENIIDGQLKPHFEKNILTRHKIAKIRRNILKRARILNALEDM